MEKTVREWTSIPDKTFPINIFFLQQQKHSEGPMIKVHFHDHLELLYIQQGSILIHIDGCTRKAVAGDMLFINSKQIHSSQALEVPTRVIAIVFNESLLRNSQLDNTESKYILPILERRLQLPNYIDHQDSLAIQMKSAIEQIITEFKEKNAGYELLIKSSLYTIFGVMTRFGHQKKEHRHLSTDPHANDLSQIMQYIRENVKNRITVLEIAQLVNMSPNHFCRVFKKRTGKTLIQYINDLRVQEAEKLLTESTSSMAEIAEQLGYGSITYFGRTFKKYKNCTPTQYRNMEQ